jgi:N-acyl-D-amino-acid deacylase
MTQMPDLIIRNGTVVDGSGNEPFIADVAIAGDRIVAMGKLETRGREEIDATGLLVTPGFVDVHTHYDGQATWSSTLSPSSNHGVTTVIVGNCGVGFAPCRAADREALIDVMEGVEDIPEAVMAEGLPWNWETFPQFLDALEQRAWDVDVGAYLPHSPLRVYVMGQRGLNREPATSDDIVRMQALTQEAMAAGALGFATSRTLVHRTGKGNFIPSFDAHRAELEAIAATVGQSGHGVVQLVPNLGSPEYGREIDLLVGLGQASAGRPVTFSLAQSHDDEAVWREVLSRMAEANDTLGTSLVAQVFPRPMGVITGLDTSVNTFSLCPSYAPLAALSLAERVRAMRSPELRSQLLAEKPADPKSPLFLLLRNFSRMYPLGRAPDYEPKTNIASMARTRGVSPEELVYDLLLEDEGHALLYLPFANYAHENLDATLQMMCDPNTVIGLGDGGAHYGLICDASYTTTLLAHWTRDREGERLPLAAAVKALTSDPAELIGLTDRGRIAPGMKADLNVIDYAGLRLHAPRVINDLPGGGRRLVQGADGYRVTVVSGQIVQRDGHATHARPGRLVRGRRNRQPKREETTSAVE